MNIRFVYHYRDAGNFKNWGELVFTNPNGVAVNTATSMAEKVLIDHQNFVAEEARIPDLHFPDYIEKLDHGWHEFYKFQNTDEKANDPYKRKIEEFIESLRVASII